MQNEKIGVILLNMGGPERLEDVRPFLYNIFSDREIIRLGPSFLQKPIAWYIARKRAPKSREIYRRIGGGSPLTEITRAAAGCPGKSAVLRRRFSCHDRNALLETDNCFSG